MGSQVHDVSFRWCIFSVVMLAIVVTDRSSGSISMSNLRKILRINGRGSHVGIVVPNRYEMNPLLDPSIFVPHHLHPHFDFSGRLFRIGRLCGKKVIIVMTGQSMINAAIATQLLLTLFKVKGIVHLGIAGNVNPNFQIGDVAIPQYWAHYALWYWQRYGNGPDDELPYESKVTFSREIGYLRFSDFNYNSSSDNVLNDIWYQPEEVFPKDGTPEERQYVFWVPVSKHYLTIAKELENMRLGKCVEKTCLPKNPVVRIVDKGLSGNIFVDNGAYRDFLYKKFNATPVDMESAAVALICLQQNKPFISIRSLSDLAGGGSAVSNEASTFASLSAQNAAVVVIQFIKLFH